MSGVNERAVLGAALVPDVCPAKRLSLAREPPPDATCSPPAASSSSPLPPAARHAQADVEAAVPGGRGPIRGGAAPAREGVVRAARAAARAVPVARRLAIDDGGGLSRDSSSSSSSSSPSLSSSLPSLPSPCWRRLHWAAAREERPSLSSSFFNCTSSTCAKDGIAASPAAAVGTREESVGGGRRPAKESAEETHATDRLTSAC